MKIGFILPHMQVYGGVRRILEISNALVKRKHDVTIYHTDGSPCAWHECLAKVQPFDEMFKPKFDVMIYCLEVHYQEIKKIDARLKIFHCLHDATLYKPPEPYLLAIKDPEILKIANSKWTREHIIKNGGVNVGEAISGGVNRDIFRPTKRAFRPLEKSVFRVLAYGRISTPWKGVEDVRAALNRLYKGRISYRLDFFESKKPVPEHFIPGVLHFNIPQKDMPKVYCSADVFVSASWFEGFGNPPLEAMACGVPVVTTDNGGCRDFAKSNWNCLIVPPQNIEAMVSAIEVIRVRAQADQLDRLIQNGLKTAKYMTWTSVVDRLEKQIDKHLKLI